MAAPMLRKGDNKYGAEAAIAAKTLQAQAKANPTLRKTLFPSSSPSGPPPSQDGNIKNVFQKMSTTNLGSQTSPGPRNPASGMDALKPVTPLASASGNAQANPSPRFQSICTATADPFKDEVHGKAWNSENFPSVDQDLAWLEQNMDDDFDDLDFDSPPTAQKPSPPLPPAAPAEKRNAMPSSQATGVSWSSSPPQHMPPPSITRADSAASNTSSSSLKRKPLDDNPSKPAPKRRGLPFASSTKSQDVFDTQDVTPPPPAPAKRYDPLEASASAIMEQRKSHKLQRTQSGGAELNEPRSKPVDLTQSEVHKVTGVPGKAVPQIFLSKEQRHVLDLVTRKGESVFFTGPAGTGKSVLMRAIISELKRKWAKDPEKLAVTASTGLAACNIGGITLHSFSGIGLGKEDAQTLVRKIRRNQKAKNRWLKAKCLVIDEVSMVDGELFDKLNQVGRTIRNNGRPWGGIQLVITGDFFQLPPVPDRESRAVQFAFDASTWTTSIAHTIGLTEVFRQRDPEFAHMLNEMRLGRVSDETVRAFRQMARPLQFKDGVEATELFPTRMEVERSNLRRLNALPGRSYRFDSADTGDPKIKDKLLQNMMAPRTIDLKVGAQVMLIKNLDEQLCNGTIGKVKAFETKEEWTLSGGGGTTEDEPLDLGRAVKRLKKFAHKPDEDQMSQPLPVVEFLCTDGSYRTLQCVPDEWKVELPNGEVQAKRSQVPLILAWALSIHKAQGQTLERVKVDLTRTFEKGQAYVALSRATTQQGLQVIRFDKSKVMAHPKVVQFYSQLYSAEHAVSGMAGGGPGGAPGEQMTLQGMFRQGAGKPKELPVPKEPRAVVELGGPDGDDEWMHNRGWEDSM